MDAQTTEDLQSVTAATSELLATLEALDDAAVREPSGLPGWTRGHVLAHIEGNARGLARLVRQLADGVERPMYISRDARNADVELQAVWPARAQSLAVEQSAEEFALNVRAVPDAKWTGEVILGSGTLVPVGRLVPQRLMEVCVHHTDLATGYTWRQWPERLAEYFIPVVARDFAGREGFPVDWVEADGVRTQIGDGSVTGLIGDPIEILAWLLGRAPGAGLTPVEIESVPTAPAWF